MQTAHGSEYLNWGANVIWICGLLYYYWLWISNRWISQFVLCMLSRVGRRAQVQGPLLILLCTELNSDQTEQFIAKLGRWHPNPEYVWQWISLWCHCSLSAMLALRQRFMTGGWVGCIAAAIIHSKLSSADAASDWARLQLCFKKQNQDELQMASFRSKTLNMIQK